MPSDELQTRVSLCIKAWEVGVPLDTCMTGHHMADVLDWRHRQWETGYRTKRETEGRPTMRALVASIRAIPVIWPATGEVMTQEESWRRFDAHMDRVYAAHGITFGGK
jgi:hypothetical protein